MARIYVLEDDENISEIEEYALKSAGHEVFTFGRAKALFQKMEEKIPDLIVLDIMLPDDDGMNIIQDLRSRAVYKNIPVVMVSAKTREIDVVKGLDYGADDYIRKPFSVMEFVSRVNRLLERAKPTQAIIRFENLEVDGHRRTVFVEGEEKKLTFKEFELLWMLLESQGRVVSRENLLEKIWGYDYEGESRTLDVHMKTLRQKLEPFSSHIQTVRNVGYTIK